MNEFALSTFSSTAGAITAQKLLNGLVSFQVMPVLREISASCGIALRFSPDDLELTKHTLAQADLPGGFALYRIQDCAPHKQITFLYDSTLRFVDATEEEHFRAMSLIHALGWRDTYVNAIPADFIEQELTDDRWVNVFREN